MQTKIKLILTMILLCTKLAWATDATEVVPVTTDLAATTQAFNEEIRKTTRRMRELEGSLDLGGTLISGILPLSRGGTGVSLTDPGADRIYFWDDSAGSTAWLDLGTALAISGTTLSVDQTALNIPLILFFNPFNGASSSCTGNACTDQDSAVIDSTDDWTGKRMSFEGSISISNGSGLPAQADITKIESTSATGLTGLPYTVSGNNQKQVFQKFFWTASTTAKTLLTITGGTTGNVDCSLDLDGSGHLVLVTELVGTTGGGNGGECRLDDVIIIREP